MRRRDKLLRQAIDGPANMRFSDLCALAEEFGYIHDHTKGSHHWYKRFGYPAAMNFQRMSNGKAVPYQVKLLLKALRDLGEID